VSFDRVQVEARPASVLVTAEVVMESDAQAREARLRLDALSPSAASELFNMTIEGKSVQVTSSAAEINAQVIATGLTTADGDAGSVAYAVLGVALILCTCTIVILRRKWKQRRLRKQRSQGLAEESKRAQRVSFADTAPERQDGVMAHAELRSSSAERKTSGGGEKLRASMSARDMFKRTRRSHRDSHDFNEQEAASQISARDHGSACTTRAARDHGSACTTREQSRADATSAPQKTRRGTVEAPPCRRVDRRNLPHDDVQPTRLPAPHPAVLERLSRQASSVEQVPDVSMTHAEPAEMAQRRMSVTTAESESSVAASDPPVYLALSRSRVPSLDRHSSRLSCAASDVSEVAESDAPEASSYCTLSRWRQVVSPNAVDLLTVAAPAMTPAGRRASASPSCRLSSAASDVSERHSARLSCAASDVSEVPESDKSDAPIYCTLSRWRQVVSPNAVELPTVAAPAMTPAVRQSSASRSSRRSSACSRSSRRQSSVGSVVELWSGSPEPQASPAPHVSVGEPSDGERASCATSTPSSRLSRSSRRRSSVGSVVELWSGSPEPQASPAHHASVDPVCNPSGSAEGPCMASSNDAPLSGTGGCGPTATTAQSPAILKSPSNAEEKQRVQRVRI